MTFASDPEGQKWEGIAERGHSSDVEVGEWPSCWHMESHWCGWNVRESGRGLQAQAEHSSKEPSVPG